MMSATGYAVTSGIVISLIVALIIGGAYTLSAYDCSQVETRSGIKTDHYLIGGCYVEVNGKMIPQNNWRGEYDRG